MSYMKEFENILIVGLGLIGGSIARKIKEISYSANVYGFEKNLEILKEANEKGLIINSREVDLKNSKNILVIFCVPVLSFREALNSVKKTLPAKNIVFTDTLSTKTEILNTLTSEFDDILGDFVLSHPIAGSEKSTLDNSKSDLFENKVVVISPHAQNRQNSIDQVINFWSLLGSSSKILSHKDHDFLFSKTSHLPHVISYSLTECLFRNLGDITFDYSGGSLEDYTRIASSDPLMWKDIMISNRQNILDSIEDFEESLSSLKNLIKNKDEKALIDYFYRVKVLRDSSVTSDEF
jgi:prephenate dehydrogenase